MCLSWSLSRSGRAARSLSRRHSHTIQKQDSQHAGDSKKLGKDGSYVCKSRRSIRRSRDSPGSRRSGAKSEVHGEVRIAITVQILDAAIRVELERLEGVSVERKPLIAGYFSDQLPVSWKRWTRFYLRAVDACHTYVVALVEGFTRGSTPSTCPLQENPEMI